MFNSATAWVHITWIADSCPGPLILETQQSLVEMKVQMLCWCMAEVIALLGVAGIVLLVRISFLLDSCLLSTSKRNPNSCPNITTGPGQVHVDQNDDKKCWFLTATFGVQKGKEFTCMLITNWVRNRFFLTLKQFHPWNWNLNIILISTENSFLVSDSISMIL